jgi:hypothetical protein
MLLVTNFDVLVAEHGLGGLEVQFEAFAVTSEFESEAVLAVRGSSRSSMLLGQIVLVLHLVELSQVRVF